MCESLPSSSVTASEMGLPGVSSTRRPCAAAVACREVLRKGNNASLASNTCFQPAAPQCSSVMSRSTCALAVARPGYPLFTASTTPGRLALSATMAPPTGTMKFLSVLCTMASTRPLRHADVTSRHSAAACTPYALLIMCGTSSAAHSLATATTSSHALGAKQLVVVTTAATFSAPSSQILARTASTSVLNSSPCSASSTTTGCRPAAVIAFRQVFWSTRDHST
mmetsp:Transcript_27569/g.70229  ORF Transcript_27569/g.70229 Transcript_27569/m.70229 type:complete len:224 (+) Transcript_27569:2190-2861(+)